MYFIQQLISEELLNALGWTVLHSLWQSMLIAIILGFILLVLQRQPARVRYWVSSLTLLLVLGFSISTFIYYFDLPVQTETTTVIVLDKTATTMNMEAGSSYFEQLRQQFSQYFESHMPLIVTVWLIGITFFLLRLLGGFAFIQHLRHYRTSALEGIWIQKLDILVEKLGLRQVPKVLESSLVQVPLTIGFVKPVILIPIAAINNLRPEEVEAILAHELAHISRADYLINFIQSVIEVLFYFNPAVWWISSNIRRERENCCDDLAVELCGDSLIYARALYNIQQLSGKTPRFAMAFSNNKNQLLDRIKRILNQPTEKSNVLEKFLATCLLLFTILFVSVSADWPIPAADDNSVSVSVEEEGDNNNLYKITTTSKMDIGKRVKLEQYEKMKVSARMITLDTLPKGKIHMHVTRDEEEIKLKVKDGKIIFLEIDGEEIPESELEGYEPLVEELLEEVPEPPTPPTPPVPPAPPAAVTPNSPPSPPAPPAPPTPPSSFKFQKMKSKTIKTEKDKDGNTLIIISTDDDEEPFVLSITSDEKIELNGDEIELEETAIILNDNKELNWAFTPDGGTNRLFEVQGKVLGIGKSGNGLFYSLDSLKAKERRLLRQNQFIQGQWKEEYLNKQEAVEREFFEKREQAIRELRKQEQSLREYQNSMEQRGNALIYGLGAVKRGENISALPFNEANEIFQPILEEELVKDGLIDDPAFYYFEISNYSLTVNGQKQSKSVHKKYLDLFKDVTKYKLKGRFVIDRTSDVE